MKDGKCAVSYAGNRFVARLGNKFVTFIIPEGTGKPSSAQVIDNVLTVTGSSSAAVDNGVLVIDGGNAASIKNGILVVE